MTVPTEIDNGAPVLAHHEVEIQAPLDEVWRLHTDVNAWTTWQSDITRADLEGAFEVGSSRDPLTLPGSRLSAATSDTVRGSC